MEDVIWFIVAIAAMTLFFISDGTFPIRRKPDIARMARELGLDRPMHSKDREDGF